jgi:hypothetical protein
MTDDIVQAFYVQDLSMDTVTHQDLELRHGSCADCPDDTTRNLLVTDDGGLRSWVLFGGREAAAVIDRLTAIADDDRHW